MKIRELAQRVGLSASMIRHYETHDLLDDRHVCRSPNGYRDYNQDAIERIKSIQLAQLAGFSLKDISVGLDAWESDQFSIEDKIDIIEQQLERIEEKIAELERGRTYLTTKRARLSR